MAFDLGSLLKDVSDSDTGREQIEYIALDLIDGDAGNFYALSDINQLANNIATVGLQQPLRVRKHPTEAGRYMVVSGHRRRAALEVLRKDDPEKWAEAACIVQLDSVSPALQQLRLIFANSDTRKMSSADLNEQTAQVEKLLYQLKEEGHEFPGRMRDHVAKVVKISNTKIATLKMIREHLADCWRGYYKNGALSESAAYELSKLPVVWQESICGQWSGYPRQLTAELVKKFNDRFTDVAKIKCSHGSAVCINTVKMRLKNCKDSWSKPCTKCCFDCDSLRTCKDSCSMAASKKKQLKADAKEAERREAQRIEERDRPEAEFAKLVYARIGLARKRSGATVKTLYEAQRKIYSASIDDPKQKALESGDGKWGPATYLPFGYNMQAASAMVICKVADALNCSVDYLLGRSDIPEVASAAPTPAEEMSPRWYSGHESPNSHENLRAVARFDVGDSRPPIETIAIWDGQHWLFKNREVIEAPCVSWFPLPEG